MNILDLILVVGYSVVLIVFCVFVACGIMFRRMPKNMAKLLGVIGIVLGVSAIQVSYTVGLESYNNYLSSSKCVAELIALNVERRDIIMHDGTCSRR